MLQDEEVNSLISQPQVENSCTVNEVISVDNGLAICSDLSEENILTEVCPSSTNSSRTDNKSDSSDVELEWDDLAYFSNTAPTFQNLCEAIACLEDVHLFFECKGHTSEATEAMFLMSTLTTLHSVNLPNARQTSLLQYFSKGSSIGIESCCTFSIYILIIILIELTQYHVHKLALLVFFILDDGNSCVISFSCA